MQRTPTDSTTGPRDSELATEARAARRSLLAAKDGPALGVLGPAAVGDILEAVCQQVVLGLLSPASSTCEESQTKVLGGTLVKVLSWYDNEWGFSNRTLDTSLAMAKAG